MSSGSILASIRNQPTSQEQPQLARLHEDALIAAHDAATRARDAARANNDAEDTAFWAQRANDIARQLARLS